MVSVAWTDLLNGLLMSVGLLAAVLWAGLRWDPTAAPLPEPLRAPWGGEGPVAWVSFLLPPFLLVLGDANLHQRFMSARSPRTARAAALGMLAGVAVLELAVVGLALLGRTMLPSAPENPAHVVIDMAGTVVPEPIGVAILASAAVIVVTTADSYLLGAATSVAVDLTGGLTTPGRQRLIVTVAGLIALALAYTSDRFFHVALYAYTLYGASLTPAVLCALLSPRVPRAAVVAGMAAGLATALAWKAVTAAAEAEGFPAALRTLSLPTALRELEPVLPALAANVLCLVSTAAVLRRSPRKTDEATTGRTLRR